MINFVYFVQLNKAEDTGTNLLRVIWRGTLSVGLPPAAETGERDVRPSCCTQTRILGPEVLFHSKIKDR
jgi:hypothetical protein